MTIQKTTAQVVQVAPLANGILQLHLAPKNYIEYQAGQYLEILLGDTSAYYSIANAPLGSHQYELHIRHSPENSLEEHLLMEMKRKGKLTLRAPFGTCDLAHLDPNKPILFIAGGTGYAPVNAMIEQLLASGTTRSFALIWGARTQSDLYLDEKVKQWQNHVQQFQYQSLISSQNKQTLASLALSNRALDLPNWQIVISGPFDMVYSTRDELVNHGIGSDNLYSDAFQFEGK